MAGSNPASGYCCPGDSRAGNATLPKRCLLLSLYPTMVYRVDELVPAGAAGRSVLGFLGGK